MKIGQWNHWSEWNRADFFHKRSQSCGNGELKMETELVVRGHEIMSEPGQARSFDVETYSEGKTLRWEIKELGDMRVERTGIQAAQETLRTFGAIAGTFLGISAIETGSLDTGALSRFAASAAQKISEGSLPRGMVLGKNSSDECFVSWAKKIRDYVSEEIESSNSELILSVGNETLIWDLFPEHVAAAVGISAVQLVKEWGEKRTKEPQVSARTRVRALTLIAGVDEVIMRQDGVADEYQKAFDPKKIFSDVDYIAVVDEERGFFPFHPSDLLKFYSSMRITKGSQQMRTSPSLGAKLKRHLVL